MVSSLKVLFLAAEATPLAKVGGLADVAGELPPALRALGVDVRVSLPLHAAIDRSRLRLDAGQTVQVPHRAGAETATVYRARLSRTPFLLVDGEPVRRVPSVYSNMADEASKFVFWCLAALEACRVEGWRPDVVHSNDWHAAPAIVWLVRHRAGQPFWSGVRALQTIHNLAYMGAGAERALEGYGLGPAQAQDIPEWGRHLPLPMGLAAADWVSTVSPTYAREILTSEHGEGLETLLQSRRRRLVGILNGIDPVIWNPAKDRALRRRFSAQDLEARDEVRRALRRQLELPDRPRHPLVAMVSRLDVQKGVDLVLEAFEGLLEQAWQLVILGTGAPELEKAVREFGEKHPDRARGLIGFDAKQARRIYGGADMLLVPSRYEPCGLAQMIGMRYGCIPIVRATGGLADTVEGYQPGGWGTGFVFRPLTPRALAAAVQNAFEVYRDRRRWRALQRRAMRRDFSWKQSALRYLDLYEQMRLSPAAGA